MATKSFDEILINEFDFLVQEFNFYLESIKKEKWGYELVYLNQTTGVIITYEFQEAYVFIVLYRLINGRIIKNLRSIEPETKLNGFSLDDIISFHNPQALIRPTYEYDSTSKYHNSLLGLKSYVSDFASNLKEYAFEILNGNFRIFDLIDGIVKERFLQYHNLKK